MLADPERVGPCKILRLLGRGGMGSVHLAELLDDRPYAARGTLVALKLIRPEALATPGALERFHREARLGQALRHEGIVRTLESGEEVVTDVGGDVVDDASNAVARHWLVLELVEGRNLSEMLRELGTLPEALLRDIGARLARALEAVHAVGAVHRDVKPANVLITPAHRVKLMDLGVALVESEPETLSIAEDDRMFLGTLRYAAPEQLAGRGVGPATDLHALGLLLHECATGRPVFATGEAGELARRVVQERPPSLGVLAPHVSPFLEEVAATLLEKEPARRFASAAALALTLEQAEESAWWQEREETLRAASPGGVLRRPRPRRAPLVGRDAELARLLATVDEARTGRGRILAIRAEPGIGKTRLVEELARRVEDGAPTGAPTGALVLRASALDARGAGGAVGHAVVEHFGARRLIAELHALLPRSARLVPALAAALRAQAPPADHEALGPGALEALLVEMLRALASRGPLVIIFDDLHAESDDGRRCVLAVARALVDWPAMLVLVARPQSEGDALASIVALPGAEELTLSRMSDDALRRLVEGAFHSPALAQRLGATLAARAAGLPLFALEMVKDLQERVASGANAGSAESEDEESETVVLDVSELPSSIGALLTARLHDASQDERELLAAAAIQGAVFDADLVARMLSRERIEILESLAHLEHRVSVVHAAGAGFEFDHPMLRQSVLDSLDGASIARLHGVMADAVAARDGWSSAAPETIPGDAAAFLTEHWLRAGRVHDAMPLLLRALRWLTLTRGHELLLAIGEMALAHGASLSRELACDVRVLMAECLSLLGRREGESAMIEAALADARAAADGAGDTQREAKAQLASTKYLLLVSRAAEAVIEMAQVRDRALARGDRVFASRVASNLGSALATVGRLDEAVTCYREAFALFEETGASGDAAMTLGNLGTILFFQGRLAESLPIMMQSIERAKASGAILVEGRAHGNLGNTLLALGRLDEAARSWEKSLELAREAGNRHGEMLFTSNLAMLSADLGDYDRARELGDRALTLSVEVGSPHGRGNAHMDRAGLFMSTGRLREALQEVEAALAFLEPTDSRRSIANAIHVRGEIRLLQGDAAGVDDLERVREIRSDMGDREGLAMVLTSLGRARVAQCDQAIGIAHFEEAARLVEEFSYAEPGPVPAAWLASLGLRDPASILVPPGALPRIRAEAHALLHRAGGGGEHVLAARDAARRLVPEDPALAEHFWADSPIGRLLGSPE